MTRKALLTAFAATGIAMATQSVHADITMTLHTTYQGPLVDKIRQQGHGDPFSQMAEMRLYLTPSRTRIDLGPIDTIIDRTTNQVTTITSATHTYTQKTYDPNEAKNLLAGMFGGASVYKDVVDTGETSQFLGHTVHHYTAKVTITTQTPNIPANMRINEMTVDLLIAKDIPQTDMDTLMKFSAAMNVPDQLKGLTLMSRSTFTSGFLSGMVINSSATSVSTASIADSAFTIPSGYTKAQPPATTQTGA